MNRLDTAVAGLEPITHHSTISRLAAIAALAATTACGDINPFTPAIERRDSAGVEIVTSPAEDRTVPWSFTEEFALGGQDEGPESFYSLAPRLMDVDPTGRIHILHWSEHRVVTFDRDGSFLRMVGRQGGGPGEIERPGAMSVTGAGEVAVFDYGKMALVRWDSAGELMERMRFPHRSSWSGRHFVLTPDGYIVATGGRIAGDRVQRLIAVTGEDTTLIAAAPQPDQGMVMFEACGGGVSFPPLFTPHIVWDHRDGITAVVAGDGYRIDIWRDTAIVRSIRRSIPVTGATRELAMAEAGDGFTIDFGRGPCTVPPGDYADARGWAETVPAIAEVRIDFEGGLWVQRRVPGEDNPPIDRFGPHGSYRGTLPAGTPFPAILLPDGGVGVIATDELDVDRLVVWSASEGES